MSWHKIIFKQIQPIHIGVGNYGVINETRIFIPGWTMWGALTNACGMLRNWKNEDYKNNKTLFEKLTCFYPQVDDVLLCPRFKDGEFYLDDKSEKEFRKEYVTTYLSTAINPLTRNAKNESLHELDVILPNNICWVGYINCDKKDLEKIKEIYVGGDSRYGFGLMRLEDILEEKFPYEVKKGIYQDNYLIDKHEPISNFVKFGNQKFEGKLELLGGYKFDYEKQMRNFEADGLYISVGSIINNGERA